MKVTALRIYPIKSCGAVSLDVAEVDCFGLVGDRRYMLVDGEGTFVTQRRFPTMALLQPRCSGPQVTVEGPDGSSVTFGPPSASAPLESVRVWSSELRAPVSDTHINAWFSDQLEHKVRLVHMSDAVVRPVNPQRGRPGDRVSFADGYPVLVATEASLQDLNARIARNGGDAVPMWRFRPNIVVDGQEAFAEDRWTALQVGDVHFAITHGCSRCTITTIDPHTGVVAGKEPLHTLATFRKRDGEVFFGVNAIQQDKRGSIRLGDAACPAE